MRPGGTAAASPGGSVFHSGPRAGAGTSGEALGGNGAAGVSGTAACAGALAPGGGCHEPVGRLRSESVSSPVGLTTSAGEARSGAQSESAEASSTAP